MMKALTKIDNAIKTFIGRAFGVPEHVAMAKIDNAIRTLALMKKSAGGTPLGPDSWFIPEIGKDFRFGESFPAQQIAELFGRNPYVFECVDYVASIVKDLPVAVCDKDGQKIESVQVDEFFAYLESAAQREPYSEFIYKCSAYLNTTGNAFIRKTELMGLSEKSLDIWHVPDVEIETVNGLEWGTPRMYTNSQMAVAGVSPEEIIHVRYPNILLKTNWGLSPLVAHNSAAIASNNTFRAAAALHSNMGAAGILSSKDGQMPLRPKDVEDATESLRGMISGTNHGGRAGDAFGKVLVLEAAYDFLRLGLDASQLKIAELNTDWRKVICSAFKLSPLLFGEQAKFNNLEVVTESSYRDSIVPHANVLFDAIGRGLLPEFGIDGYMTVDESKIPVLNRRNDSYHNSVRADLAAGIITAEEAREMLYPNLSTNLST